MKPSIRKSTPVLRPMVNTVTRTMLYMMSPHILSTISPDDDSEHIDCQPRGHAWTLHGLFSGQPHRDRILCFLCHEFSNKEMIQKNRADNLLQNLCNVCKHFHLSGDSQDIVYTKALEKTEKRNFFYIWSTKHIATKHVHIFI